LFETREPLYLHGHLAVITKLSGQPAMVRLGQRCQYQFQPSRRYTISRTATNGHYLFTQGLSACRLNLFLDKEQCDHDSLELLKETEK